MVEMEFYAPGVRQPEKMLGLALELDALEGLTYKVDTNHDIIYMEFSSALPSQDALVSIFRKLKLEMKFVGEIPSELTSKKKTQAITV